MKFFNKKSRIWVASFITLLLLSSLFLWLSIFNTKQTVAVTSYYEYDKVIPLKDTLALLEETDVFKLYHLKYTSVHNKMVTGLLSIPKNEKAPYPVIILMHGLGDHKEVDYVTYGNSVFSNNGYAVLRLDMSDHGQRKDEFYDFNLTGDYKYWTREIVFQTVFDLRRAVDFIETHSELDPTRIGYYGISLGGITGTIFCGVEKRVKVPIVALAGGQLNLLYGKAAFSQKAKEFTSIIEPLNFVKQISPRPFLMLNAKNDEVVPPMMSKLLYKKAKQPKEIIWYNAKHRDAPLEKIYGDGLNWFIKHL
ncbi:MAG: acetylxylan esterase [Arenibacter latericius]|nr:acetylxylan esterase [Arenibacter latericius]